MSERKGPDVDAVREEAISLGDLAVRPCPFCGVPDTYFDVGSEDVRIVCDFCGALGPPGQDKRTAIEEWNQRG